MLFDLDCSSGCSSQLVLHLNNTQVARDIDLAEQIGRHTIFDLVDYEKIHSFRVSKDFTFNQVKVIIVTEYTCCWILTKMIFCKQMHVLLVAYNRTGIRNKKK